MLAVARFSTGTNYCCYIDKPPIGRVRDLIMKRGEGIKKLVDLFGKYKQTLTPPEGAVKDAFCEVVADLYLSLIHI